MNAAQSLVNSVSGQTIDDFCGTPTTGDGKVVYFDYRLPASLMIDLSNVAGADLSQSGGDLLFITVSAANGNGYTANFSTTPYRISEGVFQPVELTYLNAEKRGQQVAVNWGTSTEINNDYFVVERRGEVEDRFVEIGMVQGNGNTIEPQSYLFLDEQPKEGVNLYRLRQVDFDGQETYSHAVSVAMPVTNVSMSVFPNPAKESLTIQVEGSKTITGLVEVYDLVSGRHVLSLQMNNYQEVLGISNLSPGAYIIRLTSEQYTATTRFVKK